MAQFSPHAFGAQAGGAVASVVLSVGLSVLAQARQDADQRALNDWSELDERRRNVRLSNARSRAALAQLRLRARLGR